MTLAKYKRRFVLFVAGALFLSGGLTVGYWWLYKLAPMRHLIDPVWCARHSEAARWVEEQADYRRMGSSPDLCFRGDRIGFYGDKDWFLWLAERVRRPGKFRVCGCTEYALALTVNRHVSRWGEWADANRNRSQEEWIRDGFLDYGVMVHLPLQSEDTLPLLRFLNRKRWNFLWAGPQGTNVPEAVPSYVLYNAFRWLRDSGFQPGRFALSNAVLVTEPEVSGGLVRYSQWLASYPGDGGLGVLSFGRNASKNGSFEMLRPLTSPWFQVVIYTIMMMPGALGIALIHYSLKSEYTRNFEPSAPPSASSPNSEN